MHRLDLVVDLEYQVLEPSEFIFKIQAGENSQQKVSRRQLTVSPDVPFVVESCQSFGNNHLRLHAEPGPLRVHYSALVDINPFLIDPSTLPESPVTRLPVDVLQYLYPSRYCPSDRFFQIALQAFGHLPNGYARVRAICDWVQQRTRFQAGTTTAFNCAMDTFNQGVGVCRDFAHLTISLCRALNIPARYVTSVDYGADPALGPPDFHACVEAYLAGRWYLFDPTGISPTTGLLRIATGRDANDVAFATIFGRVMWTIPKISVWAHDDGAAGFTMPFRTELAVSMSGDRNNLRRQVPPDVAIPTGSLSNSWYTPHLPVVPSLTERRLS